MNEVKRTKQKKERKKKKVMGGGIKTNRSTNNGMNEWINEAIKWTHYKQTTKRKKHKEK